jgi:beta-propeller repeat-containing protein
MTAAAPFRSSRAVLLIHLLLAVFLTACSLGQAAKGDQANRDERFGKLPLYFVENRGQVDERAEYYVQGKDKSIYFTPHGLVFSLLGKGKGERGKAKQEQTAGSEDRELLAREGLNARTPERLNAERYLLNLEFVDANPDVRLEGEERTSAVVSYFKGPKKNWKTGLKTYGSVAYRNLWPGIDLEYSGTQDRLKYQFIVHPGADPGQIRLRYHGATDLRVNGTGELEVETPAGGFHDQQPYSYQERAGQQIEVPTTYSLHPQRLNARTVYPPDGGPERLDPCEYGFRVGEYDRSRPLVIDPAVLVYAGYIGGVSSDVGQDIALDGAGNAYVTGSASSTQASFPDGDPDMNDMFPVSGFDQTHNNDADAFVAKVNAPGTALLYATYIGGSVADSGFGIAVDGSGNAYVTGSTGNDQTSFPDGDPDMNDAFPAMGFDQTYNGGGADAFVAKLNTAGTMLVYAGYIGGSQADTGRDIAVDPAGNAYVTGSTDSTETSFPDGDPDMNDMMPVPGFDQVFNGGFDDAFVAKVNAAGTALLYATFIGGPDPDQGNGIAVDDDGNAYVAGTTGSNELGFPNGMGFASLPGLPGFDQTFNGGEVTLDAFVVKLNAAGTMLAYATYLGGEGNDEGNDIALDSDTNAYVTGVTFSGQTTFPDGDPDMNDMMPAPGFDQTFNGPLPFDSDAFVAKLNTAGAALGYVTYLGGINPDSGLGIAVDGMGSAYVTGFTSSQEDSFPNGMGFASLPGLTSFDPTHNGGFEDAFVAKLDPAGTALAYAGYIGGSGPVFVAGSQRRVAPAGIMTTGRDFGTGIAVDGAGNAYVAGETSSAEDSFPNGMGFASLPGLPGPDQTFNSSNVFDFDAFVAKIALNPPPTVMCPAAVEVTAPSPAGALVMLTAQVGDLDSPLLRVSWTVDGVLRQEQDVAITPGFGTTPNTFNFTYPVGVHMVVVSVSDFVNPPVTCPVTVTVNPPPNTPPTTPVCPMSQVVTATSAAGAQVVLEVQVADADGNPLTVIWNVDGGAPEATIPVPAGGPPTMATVPFTFQYSLGVHTVDVSVSDGIAPPVACPQITVTVVNQPPTVVCPESVTVTAPSAAGASVQLTAQVADPDGHALTVTWNADGGAVEQTDNVPAGGPPTQAQLSFTQNYSVGIHMVVVTVTDVVGAAATCTVMVTVNPPPGTPNRPPTVICPENVTVTATSLNGASVTLQAQVSDADGNALLVSWNVAGGAPEKQETIPAGGPPTSTTVSFTQNYSIGTHQVVITVEDGIAPPVVCPPVIVTVILPTAGPGHAGGSGGIKTANGMGVFNFGVVGRLRGRASGSLSFKEQVVKAATGSGKSLFEGRSIRITTATFGGTTGNLTLLVRGQMKTNRYGTVPFQVDALDRGSPGVPRDEFRLTVFADTNRDGIPEPVIFSGNLVTVRGTMNNISLRPNLPPH